MPATDSFVARACDLGALKRSSKPGSPSAEKPLQNLSLLVISILPLLSLDHCPRGDLCNELQTRCIALQPSISRCKHDALLYSRRSLVANTMHCSTAVDLSLQTHCIALQPSISSSTTPRCLRPSPAPPSAHGTSWRSTGWANNTLGLAFSIQVLFPAVFQSIFSLFSTLYSFLNVPSSKPLFVRFDEHSKVNMESTLPSLSEVSLLVVHTETTGARFPQISVPSATCEAAVWLSVRPFAVSPSRFSTFIDPLLIACRGLRCFR